MIDGVKQKIGEKTYIVPPLNLKFIEKNEELLAKVGVVDKKTPRASLGICAQVIHAAISRNYPDVELEDLKDGLDLHNIPILITIIMGQSGFEYRGEDQAGSEPSP